MPLQANFSCPIGHTLFKNPRPTLDTAQSGRYNKHRKRALPADGQSPGFRLQEVTATLGEALGRLLLFCLKNQVYDTDKHKAELKQFAVCNLHIIPPPFTEGAEAPSTLGGTNRLPLQAAPSASEEAPLTQ